MSVVSGVGWNVASALDTLGDDVRLLTAVGSDAAGDAVRSAIAATGVAATFHPLSATPLSVVLHTPDGIRAILTDVAASENTRIAPGAFSAALDGCDLAVLGNIHWTRPLLHQAHASGVPIATDIQAIRDLQNPYDADYLQCADTLFLSAENLVDEPSAVAAAVLDRHAASVIGIGTGAMGAMAVERGGAPIHAPAPALRPVVSTTGAGDALFAAFLHFRGEGMAPGPALRRAVVFASWMTGAAGGSAGHLRSDEVERIVAESDRPSG